MKKNLILSVLLGFLLIFSTGCGKYTYNIEIDNEDFASFSETIGLNEKTYELINFKFNQEFTESVTDITKSSLANGFEIKPYKENDFKGIYRNKSKIKISNLNNSVLPPGFTSEGRAPIIINRNCITTNYAINIKFDLYEAKTAEEKFNRKYKLSDNDIEKIKTKYIEKFATQPAEENVENTSAEKTTQPTEEEINKEINKLISSEMKLKIKTPIKAKKHNATTVLNDYEYVWDLNSTSPIEIKLEYEKINILGIIMTSFMLLLFTLSIVYYVKIGSKSDLSKYSD